MIEHIIAAEFDIITGAAVRAIYPPIGLLGNEGILAAFMIPDGAHKRERDLTYFKLDLSVPAMGDGLENLRYEFNARSVKGIFLHEEK